MFFIVNFEHDMSLLFLVFLLLTLNKSMFKFESKTRLVYQSIVFAVNKSSRPEMFCLKKLFWKISQNSQMEFSSGSMQVFSGLMAGLHPNWKW